MNTIDTLCNVLAVNGKVDNIMLVGKKTFVF